MATADSTSDATPVKGTRNELQDSVQEAARTLWGLLDAEDERGQFRAAEAIPDRAGLTKAQSYRTTQAQVEIGGAERSGTGIHRTDPLEDPEELRAFLDTVDTGEIEVDPGNEATIRPVRTLLADADAATGDGEE